MLFVRFAGAKESKSIKIGFSRISRRGRKRSRSKSRTIIDSLGRGIK